MFIHARCASGPRLAGLVAAMAMASAAPSARGGIFGWFMAETEDAEVEEAAADTARHLETPHSQALRALGEMLKAYEVPESRIMCKPLPNQSGEGDLPADVSRMAATALQNIGWPVVYVEYDPDYIVREQASAGRVSRLLPLAVLDGGITGYDKDLLEKEREARAKVKVSEGDYGSKYNYDGGAGYKAGSSVSSLTLDLVVQDYVTTAAVPGTQVSNSIFIRKLDRAWGVGFYFQGCGGTFDYTFKAKQGRHYALRLLVELSVLEALGSYFDVPYWRCAPDLKPDEGMLARVREHFEDCPDAELSSYIKSYLYLHGAPCVQVEGAGLDRSTRALSPEEDAIVAEAMARRKCATRAALAMALWESLPVAEAKERAAAYARRRTDTRNAALDAMYAKAKAAFERGELAESRAICEEMLRLDPGNPDPKANIAAIDARLQEREAAARLEAARRLDAEGRDAEAAAAYRECLELAPADEAARRGLANVQLRLDYANAIASARRLAPGPDAPPDALRKAKGACEAALRLKPGDPAATELLRRIDDALGSRAPLRPGVMR